MLKDINVNQGVYGGFEDNNNQRLGFGLTENFLQNQHHNSISNNSNSFNFNLSKKMKKNEINN